MASVDNTGKGVKGEQPRRNAPLWIKLLLGFHVLVITSRTIPNAKDAQLNGKVSPPVFDIGDWIRVWNNRYLKGAPPLEVYLFSTGTWQYWDMFSPNPAYIDVWLDTEIIYKDGSHKFYLYPRMYKLPIPNKYAQERYRKFYERANSDEYKFLWPQVGLRVAYLNDNPKNPPMTVRLTRHYLYVRDPGKPQEQEYTPSMFFEYAVNQRDLARLRALP